MTEEKKEQEKKFTWKEVIVEQLNTIVESLDEIKEILKSK